MLQRILCLFVLTFPLCLWGNSDLERIGIQHLEKVASSPTIDWSDYQVADSVSESQRAWLHSRVFHFRKNHLGRQVEFETLSSKVDKEFAVHVVAVTSPNDPYYYNVISQAFCRIGDSWKAAPLPGSFQFTGVESFISDEVARKESLVNWGRDKAVDYLEQGVRSRAVEVSRALREYRNSDALTQGSKEEAASYFIQLCRQRNTIGVLACVDSEENMIQKSIIEALSRKQESGLWQTLLSKNYLYTILEPIEDEERLVSVGIYTSASSESAKIIELYLEKQNGRWVIELPKALLLEDKVGISYPLYSNYSLSVKNRTRVKELGVRLMSSVEPIGAESFTKIQQKLQVAAQSADMTAFCQLLRWPDKQEEVVDDEADVKAFKKLFKFWSKLHASDRHYFSFIYSKEGEKSGVLGALTYLNSRPSGYSILPICVFQVEGIWYVDPRFNLFTSVKESQISEQQRFEFMEIAKVKSEFAKKHILTQLLCVDDLQSEGGNHIDSKADFLSYMQRLSSIDVDSASAYLAAVHGSEHALLRVLGYEISQQKSKDSTLKFGQHITIDGVSGVVVVEEFHNSDQPEYRLYPVVYGKSAARFMPQAVFFYEHRRGQKLRNELTQKELEKISSPNFVAQRNKLIEYFNTIVQKQLANDDE